MKMGKTLKAHISPHVNEDDERDGIQNQSSNAQLPIIRLLFSLATFLKFQIKSADIKGEYLQIGPINRIIYVRPPRGWRNSMHYKRSYVWRLTKLPYGTVEADRQWMLTVEEWMLNTADGEIVFCVSQPFVQRDEKGLIKLLVAKQSDDFSVSGKKGIE